MEQGAGNQPASAFRKGGSRRVPDQGTDQVLYTHGGDDCIGRLASEGAQQERDRQAGQPVHQLPLDHGVRDIGFDGLARWLVDGRSHSCRHHAVLWSHPCVDAETHLPIRLASTDQCQQATRRRVVEHHDALRGCNDGQQACC